LFRIDPVVRAGHPAQTLSASQPPVPSYADGAEARHNPGAVLQFHLERMVATTDMIDRIIVTAALDLLVGERLSVCIEEKNTVALHLAI
jgi:hypothetical protein